MLFVSFLIFSLIVLARTFSKMLNRSGENGHPCIGPSLRRKIPSLSLYMVGKILKAGKEAMKFFGTDIWLNIIHRNHRPNRESAEIILAK